MLRLLAALSWMNVPQIVLPLPAVPLQVYLARLHDALAVAVKVMLLPVGPMLNEQLQQEVSLVHRCHHPGILQVGGGWCSSLHIAVCCIVHLGFCCSVTVPSHDMRSQA